MITTDPTPSHSVSFSPSTACASTTFITIVTDATGASKLDGARPYAAKPPTMYSVKMRYHTDRFQHAVHWAFCLALSFSCVHFTKVLASAAQNVLPAASNTPADVGALAPAFGLGGESSRRHYHRCRHRRQPAVAAVGTSAAAAAAWLIVRRTRPRPARTSRKRESRSHEASQKRKCTQTKGAKKWMSHDSHRHSGGWSESESHGTKGRKTGRDAAEGGLIELKRSMKA